MKKQDIIGKWFNPLIIKPSDIEDLKIGDYLVIKIQYNSKEWDYKLAWYNSSTKKKEIHIIDEPKSHFRLLGWTYFPPYNLNFK